MTEKDYEQVKNAFDLYYQSYQDISDDIRHKYDHSYRVAHLMEMIAKRLGYLDSDIILAKTIGLLHDIGRFEQLKQTKSFKDKQFDHASYAVTYLFDLGHIRDFVSDDRYDTIIKEAIEHHSRYALEGDISEEALPFCKLIRDADKIDIYEVCAHYYPYYFDGNITPSIKKEFESEKAIHNENHKTKSDSVIRMMAMLYDFNYDESFDILVETDNFGFWASTDEVAPAAEEEFRQYLNKCYQKIERGV